MSRKTTFAVAALLSLAVAGAAMAQGTDTTKKAPAKSTMKKAATTKADTGKKAPAKATTKKAAPMKKDTTTKKP
jgi:hypothetical protein